jgi:hypothetical protein
MDWGDAGLPRVKRPSSLAPHPQLLSREGSGEKGHAGEVLISCSPRPHLLFPSPLRERGQG